METKFDRRSFLRVTGTALSIGALYRVFPALTKSAGAEGIVRTLADLNGEARAVLVHAVEGHARRIQRAAGSAQHQGVREPSRHHQPAEKSPRAGDSHWS